MMMDVWVFQDKYIKYIKVNSVNVGLLKSHSKVFSSTTTLHNALLTFFSSCYACALHFASGKLTSLPRLVSGPPRTGCTTC